MTAAKQKTYFMCSECGHTSAQWMGRCPSCGAWETMNPAEAPKERKNTGKSKIVKLSEVDHSAATPIKSGFLELDRVLGGGFYPGSAVLIGGPPGVGKSTLLLQCMDRMQGTANALYVSGEESASQILARAKRLELDTSAVEVCAETSAVELASIIKEGSYQLAAIDSIQTLRHPDLPPAAGGISHLRESVAEVVDASKKAGVSCVLIGHVTKDGSIAGPKSVEHLVDTVLYFEAESGSDLRLLRPHKNRHGPTTEIGIFKMTEKGFYEVQNPSALFLPHDLKTPSGSAVFAGMEGSRALFCEVQSLVHKCGYGTAVRNANGFDRNRLNLLSAVLATKLKIPVHERDIYLNVTGGLYVKEPAADMAVAASLLSAESGVPLPVGSVFFGEIGLSGEIRAVPKAWDRIKRASDMGFERCFYPSACGRPPESVLSGIKAFAVSSLKELAGILSKGRGVQPQ